MKFVVHTFALLILGNTVCSPSYATSAQTPPSLSSELDRAKKLNTILEKELLHLEEINSTLQYLGQAINKGAITIENQEETREWIREHQKFVSDLQRQSTIELPTEQLLATNLITIKELAIHITETVNSQFKTPIPFTPSLPTKGSLDTPSLDALHKVAQDNAQIIFNLKEQVKIAGLSTWNLFARKLDDINNRYHITTIAEVLPLAAVAAGGALFLTPKGWVENIPGLNTLKEKVGDFGTARSKSPAEEQKWLTDILDKVKVHQAKNETVSYSNEEIKDMQARKDFLDAKLKEPPSYADVDKKQGVFSKAYHFVLNNFYDGSNYKLGKSLLTMGAGIVALNRGAIPGYAPLRQFLRSQWNKLKGYTEVDGKSAIPQDHLTLDDDRLVGLEGQIEELRNLVRYVTDPEMYDRTNTSLEKGILLTGPSRCGKTLLARALRDTINDALAAKGITTKYGFKEVKWREIMKWNDEGLKDIIDEAKANAPCVVFIDEIHNLPLQTKEWGGSVLTQFLTGMSGINSENDAHHQIILLAATNQPEKLDTALLQPGRFGTIIRFEKPTYQNRKKYFEAIFKYNVIDTTNIDIDELARQTNGCSYGDLETIVKSARFIARTLARGVSQQHLQQRIDQHVYKLKNVIPLAQEEKKLIAAHLAGHALMYGLLNTPEKVELVTIRGRWNKIKERRIYEKSTYDQYKEKQSKYGGIFTYNEAELLNVETKNHKEMKCKIALAGALAEEILLGSTGYSYHPKDKQKALNFAKEIAFDGVQEKDLPKAIQKDLHQKAFELLRKYEHEVHTLLVQQKALLEAIVKKLETDADLRGYELQALIKQHQK